MNRFEPTRDERTGRRARACRDVAGRAVARGRATGGGAARPVAALLGLALLASCGALVGGDATVGGETHFLLTCDEDCGPGLSCIEGVCTRGCEPGFSSCSELAPAAACESVALDAAERVGFPGTCELRCEGDADCTSLAGGHGCRAGVCRAEPTAETVVGSSRAPLVHAVDPATCESGLRWMGGDTPSAEMHPGSDCVGCHRETGARSLLFGGTLYAGGFIPGPPALDGCLGLEGVEVIVEDADGREHRAVTNRAGNFYVEGDHSELRLPYSAAILWRLDGREVRTAMFTTPSYGGCARCHGVETNPGEEFTPIPDAERVVPTSEIFTPGLRPQAR